MAEPAGKTTSQHVSEVLGDLVQSLSTQLGERIDELEGRQEARLTRVYDRLDGLSSQLQAVQLTTPKQPCKYHEALAVRLDTHVTDHDQWVDSKRKILIGVLVAVLTAGAMGVLSLVVWALRNGYPGG